MSGELLTVTEVAKLLRLSESQIYELTRPRTRSGDVREHPLPVLRIGSALRFSTEDIDQYLQGCRKAWGVFFPAPRAHSSTNMPHPILAGVNGDRTPAQQ
jgi:predicted DNA-binding transcriptional regulator AlpA